MYTRKLLNTLFVPAAVLVAEERGKDSSQQGQYCRASELPIYVPDPPPPTPEPEVAMPTYLENGFGAVRQQVTNISREVSAYKRVAVDYVEQSKDNAEGLLQYLRQEDNTTPKAGAIVIGGLTGYILGLRGRFIKRTLYASAGALGMAALCYPKEASEYSQIAIAEAKKYATIAYNFAYGVKKDDPPLELPSLPKIPTSFSEAWDTVAKSASSLVSGDDTQKVNSKGKKCANVTDGDTGISEGLHGTNEVDAFTIVSKAHDESTSKSCHCPVGACLGQHDENNMS